MSNEITLSKVDLERLEQQHKKRSGTTLVVQDRLTAMVAFHYQEWDEDPVTFACQWSEMIEPLTDIEVAPQRLIVTEKGTSLTIPQPSILLLENRLKKSPVNLSTEQEEERKQKILEVSLEEPVSQPVEEPTGGVLLVRPGRFFGPIEMEKGMLYFRSRFGTLRIRYLLVPLKSNA